MKRRRKKTRKDGRAKKNLATAATAAAEDAPLKREAPWRRIVEAAAAERQRSARRSSPVRGCPPEQQRARVRGRKREEQEREEDEVRAVAASVPSPAAFIAARGGRLASKWRSWPRPRIYCAVTLPHDRCSYRKPPHHVPHDRTGSGGDIDVTRRTGSSSLTSDQSSRAQDPRRRRLRRTQAGARH
jgi:hypothetical protein